MQHFCWSVPSSHHALKINLTAYDRKCSKSSTDSSFLENIQNLTIKYGQGIWRLTYATDTILLICWVSGKPCLGFLLTVSSRYASLLRGEAGTPLGRFSAGDSQVPSRIANSHRHSAWGASSQLPLLHICLKNPVVEKESDSQRVKCRELGGGSWGARGFHPVSSCSLTVLTPFGGCCKADLTTSAAQSCEKAIMRLCWILKPGCFHRIYVISTNTSTNGVAPLFHTIIWSTANEKFY